MAEAEAYGPVLALRWRSAPPADRVRLHDESHAGRTGRVSERLSRVLAGRRLQRLRRHLLGIPRPDHRGCLLGAARRKYHESRQLDPPRMETALAWIGKLYAIEKDLRERRKTEWRELPFEEQAAHIAAERQSRSLPLLEGFHTWLETEAPRSCPRATSEARWITR